MTLHVNGELVAASTGEEEFPPVLVDPLTGDAAFAVVYHRTDGWRGYYETVPMAGCGWKKVDEGWMTGEWDDAPIENRESTVKAKLDKLAEDQEVLVIFAPSSNVFATMFDVYVREETA